MNNNQKPTAKELADATMKNFDRKAVNYLYQHKIENGKVNRKYIAKSLVDMLGGTMSEVRAWRGLGVYDLKQFFTVDIEKSIEPMLGLYKRK